MSNFYVDHGAYASALGTTPTWGVPQDGDGKTKDAATASSVASILLNAQPSAGNLLSICGLSLGATSGGTYQYTIGGTLSQTVDNIVAAINTNSGLGAAAVAAGVAIGLPKVCNLMYARNTGGTTVEIMMRIGSATLNYASNANVGITQSGWGTPCTITNFAGGSGGCWGWLSNMSAIGVSSSIAAQTYGATSGGLPAVCCASDGTVQAQPGRLDIIYGRSSGVTLDAPSNTSFTWNNFTGPVTFMLDDGTVWSGSDAGLTITLAPTSANCSFAIGAAAGKYYTIAAAKKNKFVVYARSWTSSGAFYYMLISNGSGATGATYRNIKFTEAASVPALAGPPLSNYSGATLIGCTLDWSVNARSGTTPQLVSSTLVGWLVYEDCTLSANLTNVADPGGWLSLTMQTLDCLVRFTGCRFSGWSSPLKLFGTVTTPRNGNILVENCTGIRIDSGTYLGFMGANGGNDPYNGQFFYKSADVGGTWCSEKSNGIIDWIYGQANWPTLTAIQKDGTPWSMRLLWPGTAGIALNGLPFETPPMSQEYYSAASVMNIRSEFMVQTAVTINAFLVEQVVTYIDNATGLIRTESTFGVAAALQSSSASWTMNGLTGYTKYKFVATTGAAIKQNTRATVRFKFNEQAPTASNTFVFVDPEFVIE